MFSYLQPARALSASGRRRRRRSGPRVEYGPDVPGTETLQVRHQRPGLSGHEHCCGQLDESPDFTTDRPGKLITSTAVFTLQSAALQNIELIIRYLNSLLLSGEYINYHNADVHLSLRYSNYVLYDKSKE